jgi:hypothetical protein
MLMRDEALDVLLTALGHGEPRQFHVGVVGYYIEGQPYSADGLAVGRETTPNLVVTDDGFVCDAFFPPTSLEDAIVEANGVARSEGGVDLVRVTLEVKRRDIWAIAEFVNGLQEDLFLDPDTLTARKLAFARETDAWRRASEPGLH